MPLGNLIRKTELQGELYDTVAYGQQTVSYPRPFLFTMQPREGHSRGDSAKLARMLCLYDNAGEHFQPGQDTASSPVTRHLARSRAVMFLFDPTQDPRFRAACRGGLGVGAGAAQHAGRLSRQETILNEAAARIRRHAGLPHTAPVRPAAGRRPLQARRVEPPARHRRQGDPWRTQDERHRRRHGSDRAPLGAAATDPPALLPRDRGRRRGLRARRHLHRGQLAGPGDPARPASGLPAIRPADIQPTWVTVPLLYCISRASSRLIPRFVKRTKAG